MTITKSYSTDPTPYGVVGVDHQHEADHGVRRTLICAGPEETRRWAEGPGAEWQNSTTVGGRALFVELRNGALVRITAPLEPKMPVFDGVEVTAWIGDCLAEAGGFHALPDPIHS